MGRFEILGRVSLGSLKPLCASPQWHFLSPNLQITIILHAYVEQLYTMLLKPMYVWWHRFFCSFLHVVLFVQFIHINMYCFNPFVYLLSVTLWQAPRRNWLKIATAGSWLMRLWSARWRAHQGWACSRRPARCWSWLRFGWVRMRWFLLHMFYPTEGWPSVALQAVEQGYRKARGSVPGLEAEARNWHILLFYFIFF